MLHLGITSTLKTVPASSTIPVGTANVYVSDAGSTERNGTYPNEGGTGWKKADGTTITWWGDKWTIYNGADYYSNTGGDANNLPKTGWVVETAGAAPAPTISDTA